MCTEPQLNKIMKIMVECYRLTYGSAIVDVILYGSYAHGDFSAEVGLEHDIVVSPTVIPYDEYMKYKNTFPYYRNIAEEGRKIG